MSLKNVSIDLEPLTVFVGPNASGKSAIFKGLATLSKILNRVPLRSDRGDFVLEDGVTFEELVWSGNSGLTVKFRVWFDDDGAEPGYLVEITKERGGWSVTRERFKNGSDWIEVNEDLPFEHETERRGIVKHLPPLRASLRYHVNPYLGDPKARPAIEPILQLAERFGHAYRYRPSAGDIASFVQAVSDSDRAFYVQETGWGLPVVLQELLGTKRDVFQTIESAVCRLFPHIRRILLKSDRQGVRLSFDTDRSEDPVAAPQESDGALLATFLFWRFYTGDSALKVCLEEPENGLHPFLVADRFALLKKFAYGDPPVQLLVSTHSPEFLRAVKAHPRALLRQIRVVSFTSGAGTSVRNLSREGEAAKLIEDYLNHVHECWEQMVKGWD